MREVETSGGLELQDEECEKGNDTEDVEERMEAFRTALTQAADDDRYDDAETILSQLRDLKLKERAEWFTQAYPSEGNRDHVEKLFRATAERLHGSGRPYDVECVIKEILARNSNAEQKRPTLPEGWKGARHSQGRA